MDEAGRIELATIGQSLRALHQKFDETVKPLSEQQKTHHEDIVVLKRDRYWIVAVCVLLSGILSPHLSELLKKVIQ